MRFIIADGPAADEWTAIDRDCAGLPDDVFLKPGEGEPYERYAVDTGDLLALPDGSFTTFKAKHWVQVIENDAWARGMALAMVPKGGATSQGEAKGHFRYALLWLLQRDARGVARAEWSRYV